MIFRRLSFPPHVRNRKRRVGTTFLGDSVPAAVVTGTAANTTRMPPYARRAPFPQTCAPPFRWSRGKPRLPARERRRGSRARPAKDVAAVAEGVLLAASVRPTCAPGHGSECSRANRLLPSYHSPTNRSARASVDRPFPSTRTPQGFAPTRLILETVRAARRGNTARLRPRANSTRCFHRFSCTPFVVKRRSTKYEKQLTSWRTSNECNSVDMLSRLIRIIISRPRTLKSIYSLMQFGWL